MSSMSEKSVVAERSKIAKQKRIKNAEKNYLDAVADVEKAHRAYINFLEDLVPIARRKLEICKERQLKGKSNEKTTSR